MTPIYEYKCPKCKYQFEIIVPIHEATHTMNCPNCHYPSKRIPTAGSFRFGEHVNHPNEPDRVAEASHERKQKKIKFKED